MNQCFVVIGAMKELLIHLHTPISLFGFDGNPELKVDDNLYYRYYSYNDYQRPSF